MTSLHHAVLARASQGQRDCSAGGARHLRGTRRNGASKIAFWEDHTDPCRSVRSSRDDIFDALLRVPCTFPSLNKQQPNKKQGPFQLENNTHTNTGVKHHREIREQDTGSCGQKHKKRARFPGPVNRPQSPPPPPPRPQLHLLLRPPPEICSDEVDCLAWVTMVLELNLKDVKRH